MTLATKTKFNPVWNQALNNKKMSNRSLTSSQQLGSAMGRPPGTASRLATAMQNPGGMRGTNQASALGTQLNVIDRPVTQQGLGGMKTSGGRQQTRMIQDKTYYLGLIRGKMNEINTEIAVLQREIDSGNEENSSYLTYEKRAETLAAEIKSLQGELGDYNTLVDKLTTDEDIQDVEFDYNELRAQNEKESKKIEELFEIKQSKEEKIRQLELELEQEKRMADSIIDDMSPDMRQQYVRTKDKNEHFLKQLESGQQELDELSTHIENLQEELSMSQVKQEAVRMYEVLHDLETKRDNLVLETESQANPAEERERLLRQVKEDNQEIASMERQTNELQEQVSHITDEIRQLDMELEENHGERNVKYKELKKREEVMDEFLNNFEATKRQETERIANSEQSIVTILEQMSRNMGRFHKLPSSSELATMQQDLVFKEGELKKSENTVTSLGAESGKLQLDLEKIEQLEEKVDTEMRLLTEKINTMEEELNVYSNIPLLKKQGEEKKRKLMDERTTLQTRRDSFKVMMRDLSSQYESLKAQLNDNETYTQLGNLEKKWQHLEQNNYVMKDFISAKTLECDYKPITNRVTMLLSEYHSQLQVQMSGKHSL